MLYIALFIIAVQPYPNGRELKEEIRALTESNESQFNRQLEVMKSRQQTPVAVCEPENCTHRQILSEIESDLMEVMSSSQISDMTTIQGLICILGKIKRANSA